MVGKGFTTRDCATVLMKWILWRYYYADACPERATSLLPTTSLWRRQEDPSWVIARCSAFRFPEVPFHAVTCHLKAVLPKAKWINNGIIHITRAHYGSSCNVWNVIFPSVLLSPYLTWSIRYKQNELFIHLDGYTWYAPRMLGAEPCFEGLWRSTSVWMCPYETLCIAHKCQGSVPGVLEKASGFRQNDGHDKDKINGNTFGVRFVVVVTSKPLVNTACPAAFHPGALWDWKRDRRVLS